MYLVTNNITNPDICQPQNITDVAAFIVDGQARGLSPKTILLYQYELRRLADSLACQDVREVVASQLRIYLAALAAHRNPAGVHIAYRVMKTFLLWWEREYEPTTWSNPIRKIKPPRVPSAPLEPVSKSNVQALLSTCKRKTFAGDRDRALILTLLDTGCRASELLAANLADVNLDSRTLLIRHAKGGKFRSVFVQPKTALEISRYLRHREQGGPLWITDEGSRLTYWGLRQIVRRRSARAGIERPSLHAFRRAFALASLRGGMDVYSLQRLMGHADLSVLRRYLAQTEADLRAAHDRAGPVDHLV